MSTVGGNRVGSPIPRFALLTNHAARTYKDVVNGDQLQHGAVYTRRCGARRRRRIGVDGAVPLTKLEAIGYHAICGDLEPAALLAPWRELP